MVLVDQNPLENFKVLYATGAVKLNDQNGRVERVGGIKYTIKDGIVYDAKKLAADVAAIVERAKRRTSTSAGQQITMKTVVEDCRRAGRAAAGRGGSRPRVSVVRVPECAGHE